MTTLEFNHQVIEIRDNLERFSRKFTRDNDESQDLIQETILKALKNKSKFRDNTNFKAWMFTIMRNTFINSYHKAARSRTFIDNTENNFYINDAKFTTNSSPDMSYGYKEIMKNVDALNTDLRIPFKMYYEGFKYREIADELNIPLGTVKNKIFLARKDLMSRLKSYRN